MSGQGTTLPVLHLPEEAAALLRCSRWWLLDRARNGRIPHCRIGGGYRFTDEHLAEIIRLTSFSPDDVTEPAPVRPRRPRDRGAPAEPNASVVQLHARPPRRARTNHLEAA